MRGAGSFHLGDADCGATHLGFQLVSVPLWLVALVAAAAAPSCVRLYASNLEKRAQKRTERALESARRGARGTDTHASILEHGREEQAKRTQG